MNKVTTVDYNYMYWGPFVMKTKVSDYIIKKLKTEGKKAKESYNHALAGHIDNQFLYPQNIQKSFYNEIQPIIQAYREGHCKYHGIDNLNIEIEPQDLWINFMKAGDFNPLHTHEGDYSFVIFVDVPKKLTEEIKNFKGRSEGPGSLVFVYTQQARPKWATNTVSVIPEMGDMYIFPSLLQHWVCPFKSKVTRISVSGNIKIINRNKLPNDYF